LRQVVDWEWSITTIFYLLCLFYRERSRPESEVKGLLWLLKDQLKKEIPELMEQNIYAQFIGTSIGLEKNYWNEVSSLVAQTHKNTGMIVNFAFNYGGRLEIIEGFKKFM
jgi:undecaprenyl diphosphate synthase